MSKTRRNLLLAAGGIVVAYLLLFVLWALQPLDDAVPIGKNAKGEPVSQTVECNTLFAGSVRDDEPLPTLDSLPPELAPYEYNRTACHTVQRDARRIFALDTVLAAGAVAVLVFAASKQRPRGPVAPEKPALVGSAAP